MKRSMLQVYVKNSKAAVALYQKAFDAPLGYHVKNEGGSFYHAELDVYGQMLSVAEMSGDSGEQATGNTMQFCLHFEAGEKEKVEKIYSILKENAKILTPLGPCDFSDLMTDIIDQFGVRWCIFA